MKKRAVTKTGLRQRGKIGRRPRSRLRSVSGKRSTRVSAGRSQARPARRRRTGAAAGKLRASRRRSRAAKSTIDHDEIRDWVESRGGHPATVKRTTRGRPAAGVLRIDFPGFRGERALKSISWDEWFEVFEEGNLVFLYQDKPASRFSKLVRRKK